jgi:hypothetical protein
MDKSYSRPKRDHFEATQKACSPKSRVISPWKVWRRTFLADFSASEPRRRFFLAPKFVGAAVF